MIGVSPSGEDDLKLAELLAVSTLSDDGRNYSGEKVTKPWGFEQDVKTTNEFSLWRLTLEAGQETSMHCHPKKTTVLIPDTGEVFISTLQGDIPVTEPVLLEKGVFHRIKSDVGGSVLELEWPPNRCDLVRLEDRYGRDRTSYAGS